jgi:tetratricopeptide (TPR) repeat protein
LLTDFPIAFMLLIWAGFLACAIGRTWQPWAGDSLLKKIQARQRSAKEEAQRLQEQYNCVAGIERLGAKHDELLNQKETYENLEQIRKFRLRELEAEGRKNQLEEYLGQFEIKDAEIRGVVPPIKAALLSHGVETAADVVEELKRIPSVGISQAERLLEWRRGLEQKFVFDPARGVLHEARIKTERMVEELRFRLESELSGGARDLRQVEQEIETYRQKLQPALDQAHQELSQVEKDLEVASNRNSAALILIVLIGSFVMGCVIDASMKPVPVNYNAGNPDERSKNQPSPAPPILGPGRQAPAEPESMEKASALYTEGAQLSEAGKFKAAVKKFQEAVKLDPNHYTAYTDLGYAFYRLKRYKESIDSSEKASELGKGFEPYYNLGLANMELKRWDKAKTAFESASGYINPWEARRANTYYYLGLSKTRLREAGQEIERLENLLKENPNLTANRMELACLYLWSGNRGAARAQYEMLKEEDPKAAELLLELIKKHGKKA